MLLSGAAAHASARPTVGAVCERSVAEDAVASVSARGELALASGRTVKLLDVRLPVENDGLAQALAWLRSLAGRRVTVAALAGAADRWGRLSADVALVDEPAPVDVAELLVGEGFALVDAGDRSFLCRLELLAGEERARARRRGFWAKDGHRPVPVHDMARLKGLVGQFVLVEGVVRSVGERRGRTYLNFGSDWTTDMTVTIPKRTWATLRERGWSAAALKGMRVRARGVLEEWQGVAVEITAADMLEVLGQEITRP
jgi:endonuclease YncB( thermonuclease family)